MLQFLIFQKEASRISLKTKKNNFHVLVSTIDTLPH